MPPEAAHDEIRGAYLLLSQQLMAQRDRAVPPGDKAAQEHLDRADAAWETLGDPVRRAEYDAVIGVAKRPATGTPAPGGEPAAAPAVHPTRIPAPSPTGDLLRDLVSGRKWLAGRTEAAGRVPRERLLTALGLIAAVVLITVVTLILVHALRH